MAPGSLERVGAGKVDGSGCRWPLYFRADLTGLAEELDTKGEGEGGSRDGPRLVI